MKGSEQFKNCFSAARTFLPTGLEPVTPSSTFMQSLELLEHFNLPAIPIFLVKREITQTQQVLSFLNWKHHPYFHNYLIPSQPMLLGNISFSILQQYII